MRQRLFVLIPLLVLTACSAATDSNQIPATNVLPSPMAATATVVPETAPVEEPTTTEPEISEPPPTVPEAEDTQSSPVTPAEEATPTTAEAQSSPTTAPSPTEMSAEPTAPPAAPFDAASLSVALEPVNTDFANPLVVTHAGDGSGRLFVAEKGGLIWVVQDGEALPTPFLDISGSVSNGYEQGLLGLVFEPNRPERFYINYTNLNGDTIIARYAVSSDSNVADPNSAEVILTVEQPAANHNGGNLVFGPDGYLWIGMGDGGGAGDQFGTAQRPDDLLGSMLRIDVSGETGYTIPADNPYAGGGGAPEVWAIGLRNPWRFSFDRLMGDLWLADVGQNAWEEVNHLPSDAAGMNYGWPIVEATHCFNQQNCSQDGYVVPVAEYSHDFGVSITGGFVYRGAEFPTLQGGYFFADFATGVIWALPADTTELSEATIVLESGVPISSFGEDEAGELYITAFDGVLYRLVSR